MSELSQVLAAIQASEDRQVKKLTSIETSLAENTAKVAKLETSLSAHASGISGLRGGADPFPDYRAGLGRSNFIHPKDRCTLYVGGFPADTPQDTIIAACRYAFRSVIAHLRNDPNGITVPYNRCNFAFINFALPSKMWEFVKKHKNEKLATSEASGCLKVWFSVDKPLAERNENKRVTQAARELKNAIAHALQISPENQTVTDRVEACYRRKVIFYVNDAQAHTQRIYERTATGWLDDQFESHA
jgi:hypothetical protein